MTITENVTGTFQLTCQDRFARPELNIANWSVTLHVNNSVKSYNLMNGLSLPAQRAHSGVYKCILGNRFGLALQASATVTVNCEYCSSLSVAFPEKVYLSGIEWKLIAHFFLTSLLRFRTPILFTQQWLTLWNGDSRTMYTGTCQSLCTVCQSVHVL